MDDIEKRAMTIVYAEFAKAKKMGKSDEEAINYAISKVKEKGYYKKGGKWYKAKEGQKVVLNKDAKEDLKRQVRIA